MNKKRVRKNLFIGNAEHFRICDPITGNYLKIGISLLLVLPPKLLQAVRNMY